MRLITRIGPPPGCALGNSCTGFNVGPAFGPVPGSGSHSEAASAGGWDGLPVYTVGSVTDIPIASIVSFVHNAV